MLSVQQKKGIEDRFLRNFTEFEEVGASVVIYHGGEEVMSLAHGKRQKQGEKEWVEETLIPCWSSTKAVSSVVALMALAEAGVELESRVAEIWPEFAAGGKADMTIETLMAHEGGLFKLDEEVNIHDGEAVQRVLARQVPYAWNEVTGKSPLGYHPRTFGFLLDAIVARVSEAKNVAEYFEMQVKRVMKLDFWMGLPESEYGRVGVLSPGKMRGEPGGNEFFKAYSTPGSLVQRTFMSPRGLNSVHEFNQAETWKVGYASMGGVTSARGLAQFYAMLNQGGVWKGQRVVKESIVQRFERIQSQGDDLVILQPNAFSYGMMKDPVDKEGRKMRRLFGASGRAYGHAGAGGSHGMTCPESGYSFAYVMNQMELGTLPTRKCLDLMDLLFENEKIKG